MSRNIITSCISTNYWQSKKSSRINAVSIVESYVYNSADENPITLKKNRQMTRK